MSYLKTRQELYEDLDDALMRMALAINEVERIEDEILKRNSTHILVLDIETTGFLNQGGKIVEIGMVDLNLENGDITDVFHSVVKEEGMTAKDRDAWIFKNSTLSVEEVRDAPMLIDVSTRIQSYLDTYQVTAYNRDFDIPFLQSRGFKFQQLAPCPMLVACDVVKLANNKWPKVTEAMEFFFPGEAYNEEHRGLQDARDEARIVYKLFLDGHYQIP